MGNGAIKTISSPGGAAQAFIAEFPIPGKFVTDLSSTYALGLGENTHKMQVLKKRENAGTLPIGIEKSCDLCSSVTFRLLSVPEQSRPLGQKGQHTVRRGLHQGAGHSIYAPTVGGHGKTRLVPMLTDSWQTHWFSPQPGGQALNPLCRVASWFRAARASQIVKDHVLPLVTLQGTASLRSPSTKMEGLHQLTTTNRHAQNYQEEKSK